MLSYKTLSVNTNWFLTYLIDINVLFTGLKQVFEEEFSPDLPVINQCRDILLCYILFRHQIQNIVACCCITKITKKKIPVFYLFFIDLSVF